MKSNTISALAALTLMLALGSCRGCSRQLPEKAGPSFLQHIDAHSTALWSDDLLHTLQQSWAWTTAQLAAPAIQDRLRQGVVKTVGFDPWVAEAYAQAGLDPHGQMLLLALPQSKVPLLALSVADAARFDSYVRALLARLDGADRYHHAPVASFDVHSVARPFGSSDVPALHWVHLPGTVLIAPGNGATALQDALHQLAQPSGNPAGLQGPVQATQAWAQKVGLGAGSLRLVAEVPAGTGQAAMPVRGAWLWAPAGMQLRLQLPEAAAALRTALQGRGADWAQTLALCAKLPQQAFAVACSRAALPPVYGALQALPQLHGWLGWGSKKLGAVAGLDLERQVVPHLAGEATAAVRLSRAPLMAPQDMLRAGPAGLAALLPAEVLLAIDDEAALRATLVQGMAKLRGGGAQLGQTQRRLSSGSATVFAPPGPRPALAWALFARHYIYTTGADTLAGVLDRLDGAPPPPAPGALLPQLQPEGEALLGLFHLRGIQLAEQLRQLPGEPRIQGLVQAAASVMQRLGSLSCALQVGEAGLELRLQQLPGLP